LWFYHKILMGSGSLVNDAQVGVQMVTEDSRAMRKVEVGQDIASVGEFGAAGSGIIMFAGGRMLVKTN